MLIKKADALGILIKTVSYLFTEAHGLSIMTL